MGRYLLSAAAALLVIGCPGGPKMLSDAKAESSATGQVELWVDLHLVSWPELVSVQPVALHLVNSGERALWLDPSLFELISLHGPVYSALPAQLVNRLLPFREPWLPEADPFSEPLPPSEMEVNGWVQPPDRRDYPGGAAPWRGPFIFGPLPEGSPGDHLGITEAVPTSELVDRALHQGMLGPGEQAFGLLYFPRVPDEDHTLRMILIDAGTGEQLGVISMKVASPGG
jgi:hypothetical protein